MTPETFEALYDMRIQLSERLDKDRTIPKPWKNSLMRAWTIINCVLNEFQPLSDSDTQELPTRDG